MTNTVGVVSLLTVLIACQAPEPPTPPPSIRTVGPEAREALRQRSVSGLRRGWLSKPAEASAGEEAFDLAPLLIHGLGEIDAEPKARIGRVSRDADGRLTVNPSRPTLYAGKTTARINDADYIQWSYVWWTAASPNDAQVAGRQGFRMTLDPSGSPFLWEVLTDASGARVLFADRALEESASAEIGPPDPGQEFTLERGDSAVADVVIVRLIEAGATPLGPFVYLTEDGRDIATMLCRCMASEVDTILGLGEYELSSLDALRAIDVDPDWTTSPSQVGTLLRFPSSLSQAPEAGPED